MICDVTLCVVPITRIVRLCRNVRNNVTMKVPVFVIFEVSESSLNVESDKHHYVHVEISNCQHVGT